MNPEAVFYRNTIAEIMEKILGSSKGLKKPPVRWLTPLPERNLSM